MESYSLLRHLSFRSIAAPQFGLDGSLYFTADITGKRELWQISEPQRWPRQRTFIGRNVALGAWSPSGGELVFGAAGSGERLQLYLLDDETKAVTRLTDAPEVTHKWGGWNRDGSAFAYAANHRDRGAFDVYVRGRSETHDEARLLFEGSRRSVPTSLGWGPENDRLVVREQHSNYNADLHLVELGTGRSHRLTSGPSTEARYHSVQWGPKGDSLYFVTDRGANWRYIARLRFDDRKVEPIRREQADLKSLVVHWGTNRLAYRRSKNGYVDLVTATFPSPTTVEQLPAPALPDGSAASLTMSNNGERVATVYHVPDGKPDLYAVDVATGDTTRWTDVNLPIPVRNVVPPEPVSYKSFDDLNVPAFYAEPPGTSTEELPAILSLHPGPRQHASPVFDPVRQFFLERGFVWLEPNYRGSSGYGNEYMELDELEKRTDAIRDVKAAADWLSDRDVVDAQDVVLQGQSYGGFLVLASMTRWSDDFAGGIAIAPIANLETYLENTSPWRRENREAEYGTLDEDRDLLRELSPIHEIDRIDSPLLVVHGEEDEIVPPGETKQIAKAASAHGVPVETVILNGAGHNFSTRRHQIGLFERVEAFCEAII